MRFATTFKLVSYLMLGAAFVAVALTRELDPASLVVIAGLGFGSYWVEPGRVAFMQRRAWTVGWNIATVLVFALTVLTAVQGEPLLAGVRFIAFLAINKLWNRRVSRDWMQLYVVSFLLLIAGAALSADLSYAVCFFAYVVFSTWALTLFHLRREIETFYSTDASATPQTPQTVDRLLDSRRIVGGAFLGGTSLISLGVFIGSVIVFFVIPRFGIGLFAPKTHRNQNTVGFSDRINLDEYGRVKDNPQVIMRIGFPGGAPSKPLRMRGITFDHYQNGRWSKTDAVDASSARRYAGKLLIGTTADLTLKKAQRVLDRSLVQNVYMEPLDTAVLFGAPNPVAFELAPHRGPFGPAPVELEARGAEEVYAMERRVDSGGKQYTVERKSSLRYTVYSDDRQLDDFVLSTFKDEPIPSDDDELQPYLQLPNKLPQRVRELAKSVAGGSSGAYNKARAIEQFLRRRYKYTLDLKRDPRYEPLEDFLFVEKAGHCEYFATAMAVMLRAVGVPARSVNGFYGGEWNPYGNYLAMRHGDAHTWVEAWVPAVGWFTFDPTPPSQRAGSKSPFDVLRQLFDTVELAWFKYVLEYDLLKQIDMLSRVRHWALKIQPGQIFGRLRFGKWALIAIVLALCSWLTLRGRRGAKSVEHARVRVRGRATKSYERAVRALEKRGHAHAAGETGRELAVRVHEAHDPSAEPFDELVERYYRARFGSAAAVEEELLEALARKVVEPPRPRAP